MSVPLSDRYINLLTDFGFKRVFGTEANKQFAIDFLNTLLPVHHHITDLTFKNTEQLGSTTIDRKAVFDIYCQTESGQKIIIEIQKVKQKFFKDRSVFYATFPIQEQAQKGEWDYRLNYVYTIGVLDFVFDEDINNSTYLYFVDLKDQHCQPFYEKLQFIYIALPKFTKSLHQLQSHQDKWLFLLRYLSELSNLPKSLQNDSVFENLFDVAEFARLSADEQRAYHNSLKYYRDLNNAVNTSWEDGRDVGRVEGLEEGRDIGIEEGQRSLLLRLLSLKLGPISSEIAERLHFLSLQQLNTLAEQLFSLNSWQAITQWLDNLEQ
ncbi:MAG: Rpn family recombination-promoting nuclease/putative transposase [Symploca sp. SIO2B6]|nr:Rpn family recombination-promoting nuclease/putative transposase [Symploca sp. SIO2B6]